LPLYYKSQERSQYQICLCPATRSDRSNSWATLTPQLLSQLQERGTGSVWTLHVGVGTFRPVQVEDVTTSQNAWEGRGFGRNGGANSRNPKAGGRIIAVGTTVVRVLKGQLNLGSYNRFAARRTVYLSRLPVWWKGTDYKFSSPRSNLLMLVSALIGRQRLLALKRSLLTIAFIPSAMRC